MSVQNAGVIIREARQKAGLTQEQLSEGACSTLSLSRIENGSAGVSPATFQALMAHAGVGCEAYPAFANRSDFDCFYGLKRVRFYLDSWQLTSAYEELEKIEDLNWADNKFYYQEWLLLHSKLQFRSGCGSHPQIYGTLLAAIKIMRPQIDLSDFRNLLLSSVEVELLIHLAQESLCLEQHSVCLAVCSQISAYLANSQLAFLEKDRMLAENGIVYAGYLLTTGDYKAALSTADKFRHQMVLNLDDGSLHELSFLTALGYYYTDDMENAMTYFKTAFFSAHSIESCYATICRNYVTEHLTLSLPEELAAFSDIPLIAFPQKEAIDSSHLGDGTYDFFSPEVLTLGGLIRSLRTEQKLSQNTLCQGLCSKSKLSKIENGTQQPEIILAQTLLQRLGISDLAFTFYGNKKETELQELQLRLNKTRRNQVPLRLDLIQKMEALCTSKDTLYLQYINYKSACCESDISAKIDGLHKALAVTLPDFDFKHILNYRFSWLELTILNNLCSSYSQLMSNKGILYLYKIMEYFDYVFIDMLEMKRLFPITLGMLTRLLYGNKRFSEVKDLSDSFTSPTIKSSLILTGNIYAHYCQTLGECNEFTTTSKYINYAHANLLITEDFRNASKLKEDLYNDFRLSPL